MVTRPRQLVRQGLGRHRPIGLGKLLLVEALSFRVEACRKVRGLDKRPTQVFVAILAIAGTFLLAVAHAHASKLGLVNWGQTPFFYNFLKSP